MNRTASRCTVTLLAVATAAAATAIGAPAADAQQVLVIDTAAGRVIIDDEWRAIRTFGDMALDRTRAILYARDDEEPEAVMAFSLKTGEWIRTIPTPTGDGPRELQRGMAGMMLGRDGRLYVAGYVRVLEFDPLGQYVSNWRPGVETVRGVCEFDGQPAVVAYSGVIRRRPDGTDERFGPGFVDRGRTTVELKTDARATRLLPNALLRQATPDVQLSRQESLAFTCESVLRSSLLARYSGDPGHRFRPEQVVGLNRSSAPDR